MLLRLNISYLFIAALLYVYFLPSTENNLLFIYFLNILNFVIYFFTLYSSSQKKESYFSKHNLLITIAICSIFIVIFYNYISVLYNNNFFVFSEADAVTYYKRGMIMASKPFLEGIKLYSNKMMVEDLGGVLITSFVFRFCESVLLLNFFYIICGLLTAISIYKICINFMSFKYAYICSLAYSLSSFVLWFHSSVLKETVMVMFLVMFFDQYFQLVRKGSIGRLIYASGLLTGLMFFRPVLILFCIASLIMGRFLQKKRGATGIIVVLLGIVAIIVLYPSIDSMYARFFASGDIDSMLMSKKEMIKGTLQFTYATNILAQAIGPLTTISPNFKTLLSFYSPGLVYKILLSFSFWLGVYYIFKLKVDFLYPLVFFVMIEMVSLISILEGLELRKALPQFPFIYIIAFWFLYKYDFTNSIENKKRIKYLYGLYSVMVLAILFAWNFRFDKI